MEKIIVIVLVSAYATASPVCTDEESKKCVPEGYTPEFLKIELPWTADEDTLNKEYPMKLSMLECRVAFSQRCSNTVQGAFLPGFESFKNLYNKLCDKSSEFRAEYLEHVACLNEQIEKRNPVCMNFLNPLAGFPCSSKMKNYKNCVERVVKKYCGAKATEVFRVLYVPRVSLNIAGCERVQKMLED